MEAFRLNPRYIFSVCLSLIFICIAGLNVHAQNKRISDSLVIIYETGEYEPNQLIGILEEIAAENPIRTKN